ncbi:hypothetical protein V6N13_087237 [Hibiscus sabdariffa]|uniref:Uncharacterized protein n=1 Tax=Hibiscus sabdariffa TaxID=183260 RepID=A0ABR2FVQ7_9ROSI
MELMSVRIPAREREHKEAHSRNQAHQASTSGYNLDGSEDPARSPARNDTTMYARLVFGMSWESHSSSVSFETLVGVLTIHRRPCQQVSRFC